MDKSPMLSVLGVDEAGRGALAGPVVACAVALKPSFCFFNEMNDSKKLNETTRERLFELIQPHIRLGVGMATHRCIDTMNILKATLLAMKKAIIRVPNQKYTVVIDGRDCPLIDMPCTAKIKADTTVVEVMAASICAKVIRDKIMRKYHRIYDQYNFNQHKGYGTTVHYDRLFEFGHSPIHRLSFNLSKQLTLFARH
ncbi:MAG: ribonuclease HII [Candidatus Margulisbacteria bacterium]|nr:ribonuclease HII [Candidatus Margulisiibacteriota bacterium]